jgi:hypothetical protein
MKFSKLSHQILIVFVVVVVLSLGMSEWAVTSPAQRIVTNNILQGHQILAQRIADEITSEIENVRSLLLFLAESDVIRAMDPAGATEILTDYQARFPIFTTIYVAELSGEQIARTDRQPLENIASTYGFQIAQQGHELISDVYLPENEQAPRLTIFCLTRW